MRQVAQNEISQTEKTSLVMKETASHVRGNEDMQMVVVPKVIGCRKGKEEAVL